MSRGLLARRDPEAWLERAIARLDDWGLVLEADPKLPTWPSMVVERPVRGSWWADPEVHLIHEMGARFVEHPDVLPVVLVSAKRTCLHRRLWDFFLAAAQADEEWKLAGISRPARAMLERVQRDGRVTADDPGLPSSDVRTNGALMRELESRLLCAGGNVHTSKGSHAKYVTTWEDWRVERGLRATSIDATVARTALDECLGQLNREFGGRGRLPWWPPGQSLNVRPARARRSTRS